MPGNLQQIEQSRAERQMETWQQWSKSNNEIHQRKKLNSAQRKWPAQVGPNPEDWHWSNPHLSVDKAHLKGKQNGSLCIYEANRWKSVTAFSNVHVICHQRVRYKYTFEKFCFLIFRCWSQNNMKTSYVSNPREIHGGYM